MIPGFNLAEFVNRVHYGDHVVVPEYTNSEKKCGMLGIRRNGASGDVRYFTHRCNNFRECKLCFTHRKKVIISKVKVMMEEHGKNFLCEVFLEDDRDYRKYRDKYGSDHVLRLPVHNGTVLLIADDDPQEGQIVVTPSDLEDHEQYLNYLASTPKGKNISGGVKDKEEDTREGETIVVESINFVFDAPKNVVEALEKTAQKQTAHLDPDKDSLQDAIMERESVLQELAIAKGIHIFRLAKQKQTVYVEDINWKQRLE